MKRLFLSLFSVLLVACAVLVGGYWHDAYVAQPAPDARAVAFIVKSGASIKAVADGLQASGLLKNVAGFELFARLNDAAKRLQAGHFQLKPGLSFADLLTALSHAASEDVQVTIPEGYTAAQIGGLVHAAIPAITADEWNAAVGPHSPALADADLARALPSALAARGLEGYLFPDTYRFRPDATAQDVVHTLLFAFVQKTAAAMQTPPPAATGSAGSPPPSASLRTGLAGGESTPASTAADVDGLTPDQDIILASILQKEVKDPADMANVAGLFLNRLAAGMPLQSDATVAYAVGHAALSAQDLAADSPYNTYQHAGLPPGPIDDPGLDALDAVRNPSSNAWLYFLTTADGTVVYARTYDQFLADKAKYLK